MCNKAHEYTLVRSGTLWRVYLTDGIEFWDTDPDGSSMTREEAEIRLQEIQATLKRRKP